MTVELKALLAEVEAVLNAGNVDQALNLCDLNLCDFRSPIRGNGLHWVRVVGSALLDAVGKAATKDIPKVARNFIKSLIPSERINYKYKD